MIIPHLPSHFSTLYLPFTGLFGQVQDVRKETFLTIAISHFLILILRPDKQDYQGTAVTIDVARQLKVRNMLLMINKALPSMNLEALRQKVEQAYNVPVAGVFPLSEDMIKLASEGVFCLRFPEHPLTQEFQKVAQKIME